MTKDDAAMWAAVALRIGAYSATVSEMFDGAISCCVTWSKDGGFHNFDPPNNPADERMLWEWLVGKRYEVEFYIADEDPDKWCVFVDWPGAACSGVNPCRVTALGRAIYALPEVQ